jgi:hypothetical protein
MWAEADRLVVAAARLQPSRRERNVRSSMVPSGPAGDRWYRTQNTNQRLDLPAVGAFLDDFVPVPQP